MNATDRLTEFKRRRNVLSNVVPEYILNNRNTKLARGMTRTLYRSGHTLNGDALTLSLYGTTDVLARFKREYKRVTVTRYLLSDKGRQKLKRLQQKDNQTCT